MRPPSAGAKTNQRPLSGARTVPPRSCLRSLWHWPATLAATAGSCIRKKRRVHETTRASVDDLIRPHQHCWWYCQAKCFQGLLVNDETEAGRLLEWEIGGARSL